jgi:hypothetical protein
MFVDEFPVKETDVPSGWAFTLQRPAGVPPFFG